MLSALSHLRQGGLATAVARRGLAAMSDAVVTGLNTQKSGADPALKADEELPGWLFELASPPKTLNELRRSKELGPEEEARLVKLENREKIRGTNFTRSK